MAYPVVHFEIIGKDPDKLRNYSALGLWQAGDEAEMQAILESLPQIKYLATQTMRLTPHPSDPAAPGSRSLR